MHLNILPGLLEYKTLEQFLQRNGKFGDFWTEFLSGRYDTPYPAVDSGLNRGQFNVASIHEVKAFLLYFISGGLTNYLYLCSLPNNMECQPGEPRDVLVRIYGEILDNRAKFYEGVIFTLLAERGFGPHLYGVFSSGRIEQYIPVISVAFLSF